MKGRRWWLPDHRYLSGFVIGLLTASVILSIILYAMAVFPAATPLAVYGPPRLLSRFDVCPGDIVSFRATLYVSRTLLLQSYSLIRYADGGPIVPDTQREPITYIKTGPAESDDFYSFHVPLNLMPARYEYVVASVVLNTRERPQYLIAQFRAKNCSKELPEGT